MDDRIAKLPKWAQQEIHRLTRDLLHCKTMLATVAGDDGTPAVVSNPYGTSISLPDETVRFMVGKAHVNVRRDETGSYLYVRTSGPAQLYPSIQPESANAFRIAMKMRDR